MAGYQDLKVWQSAMRLTKSVYRLTMSFPVDERFGLTSQLRRAAVSVPSNIAEGHARNTKNEMIRFAGIALGSVAEIETQLILSIDLGLATSSDTAEALTLAGEVGRMLRGLIRSNHTKQL
jgi:four helix bundle protein